MTSKLPNIQFEGSEYSIEVSRYHSGCTSVLLKPLTANLPTITLSVGYHELHRTGFFWVLRTEANAELLKVLSDEGLIEYSGQWKPHGNTNALEARLVFPKDSDMEVEKIIHFKTIEGMWQQIADTRKLAFKDSPEDLELLRCTFYSGFCACFEVIHNAQDTGLDPDTFVVLWEIYRNELKAHLKAQEEKKQ